MDWIQFLVMIFSFVGLFLWNRTESRNDVRHMDQKLEANAKSMDQKVDTIKDDIRIFHQQSLEEHKDFHGRLCTIEERYVNFKMNQKS